MPPGGDEQPGETGALGCDSRAGLVGRYEPPGSVCQLPIGESFRREGREAKDRPRLESSLRWRHETGTVTGAATGASASGRGRPTVRTTTMNLQDLPCLNAGPAAA